MRVIMAPRPSTSGRFGVAAGRPRKTRLATAAYKPWTTPTATNDRRRPVIPVQAYPTAMAPAKTTFSASVSGADRPRAVTSTRKPNEANVKAMANQNGIDWRAGRTRTRAAIER